MAAKKAKKAAKARTAHAAPRQVANVTTLVNGQVTGEIIAGDQTIQQAVQRLATDAGLKAFSVRVNGEVIKTPEAQRPLAGVKTLEIYAKDTRG